jgi:hypothetical protein
MPSCSSLFRVVALAAALASVPGLALAAGMGGVGGGGTMGGGMMGTGGMNNMMMGTYGMQTGSTVTDVNHSSDPPDPAIRNFSHTGLRNPLRVSKAWQDVPVSDTGAAGALTPTPAAPADGAKSQ